MGRICKAVLFDMDGTLIDTEKYLNPCWIQAAAEFGYTMTREQALSLRSASGEYGEALMKEMFGPACDYQRIRARRRQLNEEAYRTFGIQKKPGAESLLAHLKKQGYRVCTSTATDEERTRKYLTQVGLISYFDEIICANMVKHGKPAPDVYLYACQVLGEAPEDCIAVEDAPNGVLSASRAGCKVIMVPDLSQPEEEIRKLLYRQAESLEELIPLF